MNAFGMSLRKKTAIILLFCLIGQGFALAETGEVLSLASPEAKVPNFWQEADITFWQTLPFAALYGYFIDRGISAVIFPGAAAHWDAILIFASAVSAGNAFLHARQVVSEKH
jgi:hypothetical protein